MFKTLFSAAFALLLLSSCATTGNHGTGADSADAGTEAAEKIGNVMLEAIRDDDYRKFSSVLSSEYAAKMTRTDFNTSCESIKKQFGSMVSYEYLTSLETPEVSNLVWKLTFERKNSDGKTIEQQVLFRLVTGKIDGRECAIGFGIF